MNHEMGGSWKLVVVVYFMVLPTSAAGKKEDYKKPQAG